MTPDDRARLLLGAMLALPGVLDAVVPLINLDAWAGDERLAVLGLVMHRAKTTTPEGRLALLTPWLKARDVDVLRVLRPALEAVANAQPMTVAGFVVLAESLRALEAHAS